MEDYGILDPIVDEHQRVYIVPLRMGTSRTRESNLTERGKENDTFEVRSRSKDVRYSTT